MSFSVLMSIYRNEKVSNFREAMDSIFSQTLRPCEVILIKDGPLPNNLFNIITEYVEKESIIKIIENKKNLGLGRALQRGLLECTCDIVARMDTDDICKETRFQKQYEFLCSHLDISVVGSWIEEFEETPKEILSVRRVPEYSDEIIKFAKTRNPMNHMTVMFRKSDVLECGNYQDFYLYEDYFLWIRMLLKNKKFHNLQESLVYARTGPGMLKRRSGLRYTLTEIKVYRVFRQMGFISYKECFKVLCVRIPLRMGPLFIRKWLYNKVRSINSSSHN